MSEPKFGDADYKWTDRDYRLYRVYQSVKAAGWELTYTADRVWAMTDDEIEALEADLKDQAYWKNRGR